jgi:hypothetical protein
MGYSYCSKVAVRVENCPWWGCLESGSAKFGKGGIKILKKLGEKYCELTP